LISLFILKPLVEIESPVIVEEVPQFKVDKGSINALGEMQLEDFTRPLYPWETKPGMEWLSRL